MAIQFECTCGKALRAKDEHAGKQAKCPACGNSLFIPPPLMLAEPVDHGPKAPADEGPRVTCPNCGEPVAANAVVCVRCGLNAKTGKVTETRLAPAQRRRGATFAFPVGKLVAAAVVVAVLGVGWFCVGAPIIAKLNINSAVALVTNGDLQDAIAEFKALRPKVGRSDRRRIGLWVRQLNLELEKNTGPVLSKGRQLVSDELRMGLARKPFKGGAVMISVELTNTGDVPITVSNDYFYLRGLSDIVLVASHTDNTFDGVVVEPGGKEEGLVAFRKLPDHPVHRQIGRQQQTNYYMFYNDGDRYVKCMLPF